MPRRRIGDRYIALGSDPELVEVVLIDRDFRARKVDGVGVGAPVQDAIENREERSRLRQGAGYGAEVPRRACSLAGFIDIVRGVGMNDESEFGVASEAVARGANGIVSSRLRIRARTRYRDPAGVEKCVGVGVDARLIMVSEMNVGIALVDREIEKVCPSADGAVSVIAREQVGGGVDESEMSEAVCGHGKIPVFSKSKN